MLQSIDLDRGCFARVLGGPQRRTLLPAVNVWNDAMDMGSGRRKNQVLGVAAEAPGIGWP